MARWRDGERVGGREVGEAGAGGEAWSDEDDRLVVVGEDLALGVPADGAGEDDFFEIAALADEVGDGLAVGDADDVLFDDGALVEIAGDVVAGGSDDFDAAGVGGVIGFCAGEGGEEAVVDVDDPVWIERGEVVREDLHVAGEDDGVDLVFLDEGALACFGLGFVGGGDGDDVEGDAEAFCGRAKGFVIGDDEGDIGFEFTGLVAAEEVVETVGVLADEEGEAVTLIAEVETPRHAAGFCEGADEDGEVGARDDEVFEVPFGAHEKDAGLGVDVLVELDDIAAVFCDEGGDGADEAWLVRAVGEEDRGGHGGVGGSAEGALVEAEVALHAGGGGLVVGDEDEGAAGGGVEFEEEVGEGGCGGGVERAGGFIGEDEAWLADEGADDGDALTFTAGELGGELGEMVGEADAGEEVGGAGAGGGEVWGIVACEHGEQDVFDGGEVREEMVGLEDEAEVAGAEPAEAGFVHGGRVLIEEGDGA